MPRILVIPSSSPAPYSPPLTRPPSTPSVASDATPDSESISLRVVPSPPRSQRAPAPSTAQASNDRPRRLAKTVAIARIEPYRSATDNTTVLSCKQCALPCKDTASLAKHQRACHGAYQCLTCLMFFADYKKALSHAKDCMSTYTFDDAHLLEYEKLSGSSLPAHAICCGCRLNVANKYMIERHIKKSVFKTVAHPCEDTTLRCSSCSRRFTKPDTMQAHLLGGCLPETEVWTWLDGVRKVGL